MRSILVTVLSVLMFGAFASASVGGNSDFISRTQISFQSSNPDATLQRVSGDIRDVLEHFEPAIDSGMTITSPKRISGPAAAPILQFSVQKCVLIVCKDADLYAEVTMRPAARTGTCTKNYTIVADLTRSSALLSDVYRALSVDACFTKTSTGGNFVFNASALRAPSYEAGMIQQQIFSLLKLQTTPILAALRESLNNAND